MADGQREALFGPSHHILPTGWSWFQENRPLPEPPAVKKWLMQSFTPVSLTSAALMNLVGPMAEILGTQGDLGWWEK